MRDVFDGEYPSNEKKIAPVSRERGHSPIEEISVEMYEWASQMLVGLDQLEREVKVKHQNFADFSFLFDKIRQKVRAKKNDGVYEHLTNLEELLEVGLLKEKGTL